MLTIIAARLMLKATPKNASLAGQTLYPFTKPRIFFVYANFKKDTELLLSNKSDHLLVVGSRR